MNIDDEIAKRRWLEAQEKKLANLGKSAVMASLVSENYLKSPEAMLQIGAAILMDKPIVLIVLEDTVLPRKLRGVADRVIRCKGTEMERASDELQEFVKSLP